ncbi:hypothetical protein F2Q69_00043152 [Brassica cretica]|uniref:Uncharacterized protein n=1 Tax=Brassica cretica TaxID=69181 RepID=A0A8S9NVB4_BRACR|nr:hypothetical protein F2Q69_00043152 [Brassica cretica]
MLGRYVATELWLELGRYVATGQRACALYLGNIRCDVLLTEHDLLRKDIFVFCRDLDINFVVTVFDPNIGRYVATELGSSSVATWRPILARARSLRTDRAIFFGLFSDVSCFFRMALLKNKSFPEIYFS